MYNQFIGKMPKDELYTETMTVISQHPCNAPLIHLCYNEWKNREMNDVFLDAYNEAIHKVVEEMTV